MADLSDVSKAIVDLIGATVYPNGTASASAFNAGCKIYPGWPNDTALSEDLRAGLLHISVFPQPGIERVVTRYPREWMERSRTTPTITASLAGHVVTIGGTITATHYATIIIGNTQAASQAAVAGDTLSTFAAALGAQITGASVVGAAITLPAAAEGRIKVRTAAPGLVMRELRRQQKGYQITIWAPSDSLRIAAANVIDPVLTENDFLSLPDTSKAWLIYRSSADNDMKETAMTYRRDLLYFAEYATTQTMSGYVITDMVTQIEPITGVDEPFEPLPFGVDTPGFVFTPKITRNS